MGGQRIGGEDVAKEWRILGSVGGHGEGGGGIEDIGKYWRTWRKRGGCGVGWEEVWIGRTLKLSEGDSLLHHSYKFVH